LKSKAARGRSIKKQRNEFSGAKKKEKNGTLSHFRYGRFSAAGRILD